MEAGRRAIGGCKAPAMKTSSDSNFPERLEHGDSSPGSSDRFFGLLFSVFWSVVAMAPLRKGGPIRVWAVILAAAFLVPGLVRPTLLGPLNQLWQRFGTIVAKAHQSYRDGGPVLFDHRPFCTYNAPAEPGRFAIEVGSGSATYWIPRKPPGPPPESMKDQF